MSEIADASVMAQCRPGETAWEGFTDDTVIFQRRCDAPGCDGGLLLAPARFCGSCGGTGFRTRTATLNIESA